MKTRKPNKSKRIQKSFLFSIIMFFVSTLITSSQSSFTDDYSTPSSWTMVSNYPSDFTNQWPTSSLGDISVNNNVCKIDRVGGYCDKRVYRSITNNPITATNSWAAEIEFTQTAWGLLHSTSGNMGAGHQLLALTEGSLPYHMTLPDPILPSWNASNYLTDQDAIMIEYVSETITNGNRVGDAVIRGRSKYGTIIESPSTGIPIKKGTKYYLRIERVDLTHGRISVFSNPLRTIHVANSPQCFTINTSLGALYYVQHSNIIGASPTRIISGIIDNLKICSKSRLNLSDISFQQQKVTTPIEFCNNSGIKTFSVSPVSGTNVNYTWQTSGRITSKSNSRSIDVDYSGFTGTDIVTVTVTQSCLTLTKSLTITVNSALTPGFLSDQPVCLGQNAQFDAIATGTSPITYQWFFNNNSISGATNSSLTFNTIQSSDAGNYYCKLTNVCGTTQTNIAKLTVNSALIAASLADQDVCSGQKTQFVVSATGSSPINYEWYHDNILISGATNASLIFNPVQLSDAGNYFCVLDNVCGTVQTNVVELTVYSAPMPDLLNDQKVCLNNKAQFDVTAKGTDPMSYQWFYNNSLITGETNPMLTIFPAQLSDAGNYYCELTNLCGKNQTNTAILSVPTMNINYESKNTTFGGSTGSIDITVNGTGGKAGYSYVWISPDHPTFSSILQDISHLKAGTYEVIVTDISSACEKVASITIGNNVECPEYSWLIKTKDANSISASVDISTDYLNNVFIAGSYTDDKAPYNDNLYVEKYDKFGNKVWSFNSISVAIQGLVWDWVWAYDIATDMFGNVFVVGSFSGEHSFGRDTLRSPSNSSNIFLIKLNGLNGSVMWSRHGVSISGSSNDIEAYAICTDAIGNVYITGECDGQISFGQGLNFAYKISGNNYIAKFNGSTSNMSWVRNAGGGYDIATDVYGNVYVTGDFGNKIFLGFNMGNSPVILGNQSGKLEMYIAKYNPNGRVLWANKATGDGHDIAWGIATDAFGNVYATGTYKGNKISFDNSNTLLNKATIGVKNMFIVKYEASSGNVVWAKTDPSTNSANQLAIDLHGDIWVIGDAFTQFNQSGDKIWSTKPYSSANAAQYYGLSVDVDNSGNVLLAGIFKGTYGNTVFQLSNSKRFSNILGNTTFLTKLDKYEMAIGSLKTKGVSSSIVTDGEIHITMAGGIAPFNYKYTTGSNITYTNKIDILDLAARNYDITITDEEGCELYAQANIYKPSKMEEINTGIDLEQSENTFSIYPNPFIEKVTVEYYKNGEENNNNINVYNSQGKLVFQKVLSLNNNKEILDFSEFNKGVYLLTLSNDEGLIKQTRLVKY